ncbi:MAG: zinc-dependent alcohol dehydrogenase family protein [Armatimonadetes bacterium]|nr:zinc-dependent alcohol dehydrogenase family protein [Armatimonadota bacterium]
MRAAVIERPLAARVEERDVPEIGPADVRVRVAACGVCGTDAHIFHGGFRAQYPVVPGHEFAGEVAAAGADVAHVRPGDRVAVDPNIHCGVCPYCRRGRIHLCENLTALGVNIPGGFQEFCRVPAQQAYRLPETLSFAEAAFAEPLACCVHGMDRARIQAGDTVVVLGAGTIGLLMLQLARLEGARRVVVSEPAEAKADLARRLGADVVVNPLRTDLHALVRDQTGIGADVVIECVGSPRTVAQALALPRRGGRVLLFGVNPKDAEVPIRPYDIFLNELAVIGSYINPYTHARAIALIADGRVRVRELVTHRFALADFPAALALAAGPGAAVKVLVTF